MCAFEFHLSWVMSTPFSLYKDISEFPCHANMMIIHTTKTGCHNWQHGQHSSVDSVHLINIYQEPRRSLAVCEVPATPTLIAFLPSAAHENGRQPATSGWENVFVGRLSSASNSLALSDFSHGLSLHMNCTQRYNIQSSKCIHLQDSLILGFSFFSLEPSES